MECGDLSGKDAGLPGFCFFSVQRFNASAHLSLQTKVVLRVAEVIF